MDKHIRKLDKELLDFEADVIIKCGSLAAFVSSNEPAPAPEANVDSVDANSAVKGKPGVKVTKKKKAEKVAPIFVVGKKKKKWGKKLVEPTTSSEPVENSPPTPVSNAMQTPGVAPVGSSPMSMLRSLTNETLDMPVDPNEPTYCVCNQVSWGEMVGCDAVDVSRKIRKSTNIKYFQLFFHSLVVSSVRWSGFISRV